MTGTLALRRWPAAIVAFAALQGAAGVALSAAAAHVEHSLHVATASQFLIIHAAAALALAAIAFAGPARPLWLIGSAIALQAGVTLFASDLSVRALTGARLFPYAAPIGGSLVMASWLAIAGWALAAAAKPRFGEERSPSER